MSNRIHSASARAARDMIATMLEPLGFSVTLARGGKHYRIHCEGPIRAVYQLGMGAADREISADWARQWAQRIIKQLKVAA